MAKNHRGKAQTLGETSASIGIRQSNPMAENQGDEALRLNFQPMAPKVVTRNQQHMKVSGLRSKYASTSPKFVSYWVEAIP